MEKILIIDDSQVTCELLSMFIKKIGYEAKYTLTLQEGLEQVLSEEFDVVFLDVNMPDGNGLDMLPKIKEAVYDPEVIIITAFGNPDGAEIAIKSGAWDYIEKAPSPKKLMLTLTRALEYRKKKKTSKQALALKREGIIGNSPKIKTCLDFLAQAANSCANVLITGQTGTGKELFARAIHDNSQRQNNNFVVVDCASLPATLIESVLFGHEKGSFTGADKSKVGLIMQADKGTLFLDEVGELPLNLQKAFLRVLQEQRFRPIGSKDEIKSDFRLLAATNKDLDEMVSQKIFREDFLFRLRSLSIELPPLKERLEDIKPLAVYFINEICLRYHIDIKGFSSGFLDALTTYEWPGNVRELFNTLEGTIALAGDEPTIFERHLPTHLRICMARSSVSKKSTKKSSPTEPVKLPKKRVALKEYRDQMDKKYLEELLLQTSGNIKKAVSIAGLSRSRLYALLKKHKIPTLNLTSSFSYK